MARQDERTATELLLRCLRRSEDALAGLDVQYPDTEWHEVGREAARYGLEPLLFRRLKERRAQASVPVDVWECLRLAYFASADRSLLFRRELRAVLDALRNHGINAIALKGSFLAEVVYHDAALRPMSDIDLLVPSEGLSNVRTALSGIGYRTPQGVDIEEHSRRAGAKHLPPFVKGNVTIEVHWTIISAVSGFKVDLAGLWNRAQATRIAGTEAMGLSSEDLLLHICLQACSTERFLTGLRPFWDIAEIVRHYGTEMDWQQLVSRTREWGAARYVGLTLQLAANLTGARVPGDVLERLVPEGIEPQMLETARRCAITRDRFDWHVTQPFLDFWMTKSVVSRVSLFWKRVFLPREQMAVKYPECRTSRHLYRYYLRRVRDLTQNFLPGSLRMLRSPKREENLFNKAALTNWLRSGKS